MSKKPTKTNTASSGTKTKQASPAISTKGKPTKQIESKPVVTTRVQSFEHSGITQDFVLVLLDENFDEDNANCLSLVAGLQSIAKNINVFDDIEPCMDFLKNNPKEEVFLIVSDHTAQQAMTSIHDLTQVTTIFIFSHSPSEQTSKMKHWSKVRGVFTSINELCQSVAQAAQPTKEDPIGMSFVSSNDIDQADLDHLNQSFMYTELIKNILLEMTYDAKSIQDLVSYCRKKYEKDDKQLKIITRLEQEYREHLPIWWYTCDSFLYHMLNKALREQHFESIIRLGFFIYDLHRHIEQLHREQKSTFENTFQVYRGQGMSYADFEQLKKSKGGLLAFNCFLSTTLDPGVTRTFMRGSLRDAQSINIFFTLTIDPSISSAPFAQIDGLSFYKGEKEILFSMLTVFRIERIEQSDVDDRIWNVDLKLTSDSDQQLNRLIKRMQEEIEGSTALYRLGALMIKLGQFDQAEEVNRTLVEHVTRQSEQGDSFYQLGQIKYGQQNYDEAISYYHKALQIYSETLGVDHPNIATTYNNLGLVYDSQNNYSQALDSYQKAREIYENKLESDHPILASCYNNIAAAYDNMKDHKQALVFYDKAYEIYKEKLPEKHPHIATHYSNIGLVHLNMQEYTKALECFENAVRIGRDTLPPGHPDLEIYVKNYESTKKKVKK